MRLDVYERLTNLEVLGYARDEHRYLRAERLKGSDGRFVVVECADSDDDSPLQFRPDIGWDSRCRACREDRLHTQALHDSGSF